MKSETLNGTDRVTLNGTDLNVSRACLGTMTFGSPANESESRDILDYAIDQGINFVDTANIYSKGAAEEIRSEERRVGKECRSRWSPHH